MGLGVSGTSSCAGPCPDCRKVGKGSALTSGLDSPTGRVSIGHSEKLSWSCAGLSGGQLLRVEGSARCGQEGDSAEASWSSG